MQEYWAVSDTQRRAWQPLVLVQAYYRVRFVIHAILLLVAVIGLIKLFKQAHTIPVVYSVDKYHRVTLQTPKPFQMDQQKVSALVNDVMSALFTRTEYGRIIPDLSYLVDEAIITEVDRPFAESTLTEEDKQKGIIEEPYMVRLIVLDNKGRIEGGILNVAFKTLFTIQSRNSFSNSIVYFDTRWDKIAGNEVNPLGYMLSGIVVSTETLYNRDEILEDIRARTAIITEVPIPDVVVSATESATTDQPKPASPVTIDIPILGEE